MSDLDELLRPYLESSETTVSRVHVDDEAPISRYGEDALHVDGEAYTIMEEAFDLHGEEQDIPGKAIHEYFTDRRDAHAFTSRELEASGMETDDNGNPYLSELLKRKTGSCAEIALTAQIWADEMMDDVTSYMVNGAKQDENHQVSPHAYLIWDTPEGYLLVDPSRIVTYEGGTEDIFIAPIEDVSDEGEITLADDIQETLGFTYTL